MGREKEGPRPKYLSARPEGDGRGVGAGGVANDTAPAFTVTRGELSALVTEAVALALSAHEGRPKPALLDREGLAAVLGVSSGMVDKLRRRGLPHYRIGDSPRFDLDACLEWIWRDNGSEQKAEGA